MEGGGLPEVWGEGDGHAHREHHLDRGQGDICRQTERN